MTTRRSTRPRRRCRADVRADLPRRWVARPARRVARRGGRRSSSPASTRASGCGSWREHRVSSVFVVPTMLQRILDHPDFATTDLSSLAAIYYGAAAAPVELVRRGDGRAADRSRSATSSGRPRRSARTRRSRPTITSRPERIGSVGRRAARRRDPGRRSGHRSRTCRRARSASCGCSPTQNVRPGWLRTGDLARHDADGYIYPSGRLSDTINRGGEKFGPVEIETVLREHPAVADVAAAGIPDAEMGERVGVAVVDRGADDRRRGEGLVLASASPSTRRRSTWCSSTTCPTATPAKWCAASSSSSSSELADNYV